MIFFNSETTIVKCMHACIIHSKIIVIEYKANEKMRKWPLMSTTLKTANQIAFLSKRVFHEENDSHELLRFFFDVIKQNKCQ